MPEFAFTTNFELLLSIASTDFAYCCVVTHELTSWSFVLLCKELNKILFLKVLRQEITEGLGRVSK